MSWQVMVYNNVTETLVEVVELDAVQGVPNRVFQMVSKAEHLDAYYHCVTTDNKVRWGLWSKIPGEWVMPYLIPDAVKMIGVLSG